MDIEERLEELKRSFKDDIANLVAKNAELEARNQESDKKISELRQLVEGKNGGRIDNDESDDKIWMNTNAYTFLYTSPMCSGPFIAGVTTCLLQYIVFSLFLLDLLNTTSIPPGVAALVRVCQAIAILIAFVVESDMLLALRAIFYCEGFVEMIVDFDDDFNPRKFYFGNTLMGMQGLLGKFVAFLLIIFADNVFDLLLNFTAVMFVSELDEIVFLLSANGYVGKKAEFLAKKIQRTKFPQRPPKGIMRYMHLFLYGLTMVVAFIAFAIIARQQDSQESLADFVKVQFGDEVDPTLGLFSGCYEKQLNDGWNARVRYVQTQTDRGKGNFEYCLDDGLQTWVFAKVQSETACTGNFALQSAEERSTSFDLLDAKGDQWLLGTGNPIGEFQLGEIDPSRFEIECGNISVEGGTANAPEELCPIMTIDADAVGFSGSRDWSRTFVLLENVNTEAVQYYQRPVFIGDFPGTEGYEVLFFAGRRWALASAKQLLAEDGDPFNRDEVISLFQTSTFWLLELSAEALSYLSEDVNQGNDRGTPLGLQWYNARHADGVAFPFADISRPVDASFRCGKCNGRNNPCLYEGICQDDGTCNCRHGASGKLCEIKPLGDGVCNPFFNTAPDEYDGGDCCVATCSKTSCGVGAMDFAFSQSLTRNGTGFQHCTDPSMVPLTILLDTEIELVQGGTFFESYTVEVMCEGGARAPLRVALDPYIEGKLNETLYVDDKTGSCLLSFTGIQSFSGLSISYQIVDGSDSSAEMLLMNETKNISVDGRFTLPTLYSRCLKETLVGVIDPNHLYTGSYQDEAFAWLSNEAPMYPDCSSNQDYLIQRFAMVALNTAEEAPKSWISSSDHCLWSRVTCDGSRVVELTYDGNTNGGLGGSLANEFTLLRHLERLEIFGNNFILGTIPAEISELTALTALIFQANQRTGTIPSGIFELTALEEISMAGNALSGTLTPALGYLNSLSVLTLYRNFIVGTIPSEVGKLSFLQSLDLGINGLVGTIPSEIGRLTSLTVLGLNINGLSESIPSQISSLTSLQTLYLFSNFLTGALSSEIGSLSSLTDLWLYNNTLSGTVCTEIGKLTDLEQLFMDNNAFTGTIPSEVGNMSSLIWLSLPDNALSGNLPSEIGELSALTAFWLHDNGFSGTYKNAFTGTIPSEVGKLSALKQLYLQNNALSGTVLPSEIGNLSSLEEMVLFQNALSGTICSEVGKLLSLKILQLNTNSITGSIPSEIGNLSALSFLSIYDNAISGTICSEIGRLSNLTSLFLNTNAIKETIPSEIGSLKALAFLSLYDNAFSGTLPSEVGTMTALRDFWSYNNALSGTLPSQVGTMTSLRTLHLNNNVLSGTLCSEIGSLSSLSELFLHNNAMSGAVPSEVGSLSALTALYLYNNTFSGTLSSLIGNLKNLIALGLHENAINGSLPTTIGLLDDLVYLNVRDNLLNETVPSEIGLLTNLQFLIMDGNNLESPLPSEILQLTNLNQLALSGNRFSEEEVNDAMAALGLF